MAVSYFLKKVCFPHFQILYICASSAATQPRRHLPLLSGYETVIPSPDAIPKRLNFPPTPR